MSYKFIWKIKLDPEFSEEEFIKFWRETSQILQEYPGAMGTKMNKVVEEDRTYIAIAEWESKDARDSMQADIDNPNGSARSKRWQKYAKNESWGEITLRIRAEEIDEVHPN